MAIKNVEMTERELKQLYLLLGKLGKQHRKTQCEECEPTGANAFNAECVMVIDAVRTWVKWYAEDERNVTLT